MSYEYQQQLAYQQRMAQAKAEADRIAALEKARTTPKPADTPEGYRASVEKAATTPVPFTGELKTTYVVTTKSDSGKTVQVPFSTPDAATKYINALQEPGVAAAEKPVVKVEWVETNPAKILSNKIRSGSDKEESVKWDAAY